MAWPANGNSIAATAATSCWPFARRWASRGSRSGFSVPSARAKRRKATSSTAGRPSIGWRGSCSGRSTAPTGVRCWTTASDTTSTVGTTTWRRATWRPSMNPIRGSCALPTIWNRSAARTACCRSKISASRRSGSITSPTSNSGTSNARSICTRRRCSNMPWRRWPAPAATTAGPRSSPAAAATSAPLPCGGSGAPRGACSSITCRGSTRKRAPACVTARWPRPCCSTNVPTATRRRQDGPWSNARPNWGSPTRATPVGATGPSPGWAGPTWSSASSAAAGQKCRRSSSTIRSRRTGLPRPTRLPSGATARWRRSTCSSWTSRASGPPRPVFPASRSARNWATSLTST